VTGVLRCALPISVEGVTLGREVGVVARLKPLDDEEPD
jgi:hypothetical protein